MDIQRISAFSHGNIGGNPAGVVICDELPSAETMQASAAEVGYSETVFAMPKDGAWRARYFSPESEVPFCGHATIALGAALAQAYGDGTYNLTLNDANISVRGAAQDNLYSAALVSPPTHSKALSDNEITATLALLGYTADQLDLRIPPARAHGGADHYVLALKNRKDLAALNYDLNEGRTFMNERDLVTIMLVYIEDDQTFHSRNAFASGGVFEDPATGAATAAFSGYLRDIGWPHQGRIQITQGEDMGLPSDITAEFSDEAGSPITVSGTARNMV
ncbi:PhzF family phenazine biosynthesis protein [Amylibacter sp. SFDW26]|uniref:PhzF family phenazine biosynthesis protein n=1 Tax=Amylibacter sp. SFDW26 TaxID=2652722 RepID=UPI00126140AC|nr:PhzF family phenazine biosynthesis protein [Amylibacter sp. SFDW26]KAB7615239.1 PhzF family phenazine biosynthesis protein [Amylibacter sp. SFDW26]